MLVESVTVSAYQDKSHLDLWVIRAPLINSEVVSGLDIDFQKFLIKQTNPESNKEVQ